MKDANDGRMRHVHLSFVGVLTAGVTHELKNHLAIIKEASGLANDLLHAGGKGPEEEMRQKYADIFRTIDERISMAAEMLSFLNGFSHRMDAPRSFFDLARLIDELIALMQRMARQRNLKLTTSIPEAMPSLFSDPSLLQFALFTILAEKMRLLAAGGEIVLEAREKEGAFEIGIASHGDSKPREDGEGESANALVEALDLLGAAMQDCSTEGAADRVSIIVRSMTE